MEVVALCGYINRNNIFPCYDSCNHSVVCVGIQVGGRGTVWLHGSIQTLFYSLDN